MSLVSVVLPCYRHEHYIRDCLESVFYQTYSDVELIVLDDCSPDSTYLIASDLCASINYRQRFKKIICQRNEGNLGAHATLNRGIALASGEYVSLLNSDDQYHPARIATLLETIEGSGTKLAFSNYLFIDNDSNEVHGNPLYIELQDALASAPHNYPAMSFSFLQKQVALSTGNLFFERELFKRVGGFLDLKYCHDWDFILQSMRFTEPAYIDMPLYRYRIHGLNTFRTLRQIAEAETDFVLERFFSMSFKNDSCNIFAPTERNWPGLFKILIDKFGLADLYAKATTGYLPWHRIVD